MRVYLKVKIKSLAAEAKIIRFEERRLRPLTDKTRDYFLGLMNHRRGEIRTEARASLLAYGFIRGRTYRSIESKTKEMGRVAHSQLWAKVNRLVVKYGPAEYRDPKDVDKFLVAWASVNV